MDRDLSDTSMSRARGDREKIENSLSNTEVEVNSTSISVEKIVRTHVAPNKAQNRVESMVDSLYGDSDEIAVWVRTPADGKRFILVGVTDHQEDVVEFDDLVDSLPNRVNVRVETDAGVIDQEIDVYLKHTDEKP